MRKILFLMFILMIGSTTRASGTPSSIYFVAEWSEIYQMRRLDILTQEQVTIFEFAKQTSKTFAELAPQDEIDFVKDRNDTMLNHLDDRMEVDVKELVIAPDEQQVAVVVGYSIWDNQSRSNAGFTQILLIDTETGANRSVFTVGQHSNEYIQGPYPQSIEYESIASLKWLPNQTGLVAGLSYNRLNYATQILVLVPLSDSQSPFVLGDTQAYALAANNTHVVGISGYTSLLTRSFDIKTGTVKETLVRQLDCLVPNQYGLVLTQSLIHFSVVCGEATDQAGLAFLDPLDERPTVDKLDLMMLPPSSRFLAVRAEAVGNTIYIESSDRSLWLLNMETETPTFDLVIHGPIDFWNLNKDGDILLHQVDMPYFQILAAPDAIQDVDTPFPFMSLQVVNLYIPIEQKRVLIDW